MGIDGIPWTGSGRMIMAGSRRIPRFQSCGIYTLDFPINPQTTVYILSSSSKTHDRIREEPSDEACDKGEPGTENDGDGRQRLTEVVSVASWDRNIVS